MGADVQQLVTEIVTKTSSELILFFILFLIGLILVFIPIYRINTKTKENRMKHEMEQWHELVQVVSANTEVMTSLKSVIEHTSHDNKTVLERIQSRIDDINASLNNRPCARNKKRSDNNDNETVATD